MKLGKLIEELQLQYAACPDKDIEVRMLFETGTSIDVVLVPFEVRRTPSYVYIVVRGDTGDVDSLD